MEYTENNQICRLCAVESGDSSLINVFDVTKLAEEIYNHTSILINESDQISTSICLDCNYNIAAICEFRERCLATQKIFLKLKDHNKQLVAENKSVDLLTPKKKQWCVTEDLKTSEKQMYATAETSEGKTDVSKAPIQEIEKSLSPYNEDAVNFLLDVCAEGSQECLTKTESQIVIETAKPYIDERNINMQQVVERVTTGKEVAIQVLLADLVEQTNEDEENISALKIESKNVETIDENIDETNNNFHQITESLKDEYSDSEDSMDRMTDIAGPTRNDQTDISNEKPKEACEVALEVKEEIDLEYYQGRPPPPRFLFKLKKKSASEIYKSLLRSCHICGKMVEKSRLREHVNRHLDIKPYVCSIPECKKSFHSKYNLSDHMRDFHSPRSFQCNICGKSFDVRKTMYNHRRKHQTPQYTCKICNRVYKTSTYLKQHIRTHTGERPYNCEHCKKPFASLFNLKTHERSHTKEKPYKCTMCEAAYNYNSLLKLHVQKCHNTES